MRHLMYGGSVSFLLSALTPLRLGLAGLGIVGTLGPIVTVWRFYRNIRRLLIQL